jgi:putative flavoprotein involved in K+ transport
VEDLLEAGRRVFLSTSMVARYPRRYRGRDIIDWMIDTGFWDVRLQDLEDPAMQSAANPQVSGVGPRGRSVSLQGLARAGAVLVGRLTATEGTTLHFADDAPACVRFSDEKSATFKRMIDAHIERTGTSAPASEPDPNDLPDDGSACRRTVTRLDLRRDGLGAIIWCTGFRSSLGWIRAPVFDEDGRPAQVRGVSAVPGIYFLGAPWLHKRKSGVLYGMPEDAEFIVQHISDRARA